MATFSNAVLDGHLDPMDLARTLIAHYGARGMSVHFTHGPEHYELRFEEARRPEDAGKPERLCKGQTRTLSVFTNSSCACDYVDVTTDETTSLLLGWGGDEATILRTLVEVHGGWLRLYADEQWTRFDILEKIAA